MTDSSELYKFEAVVSQYYERCKNNEEDYYQLLGIPRTAVQKVIEAAYTTKIEREFPRAKIEHMQNPEIKEKAVYILQRIDYMYSLLINPEKRAEYDKTVSREISLEDIKEESPIEKAKNNFKLGKSLLEQKAYPMALTALTEAVRLDPNKAVYYQQLALCQGKVANLRREAEKNLQKAIELEPWNAKHHAALGILYYKLNMNVRAESSFREALSLDPENQLAIKGLAEVTPKQKPSSLKSFQNLLKKAMPSLFDK